MTRPPTDLHVEGLTAVTDKEMSNEPDCLYKQAMLVNSTVRFDTDSVPVKIDNCCTQTMSGYLEDFIPSTLNKVSNKHVHGFAKTRSVITHQGTVRWGITDDMGKRHYIHIPNLYYVPGCELRLLSPQHWSQEAEDD
jgi:hypothetical protein